MADQKTIPQNKVARALALAGSGVKMSGHYLKYRTKRALSGVDDRAALHEANATTSYATLSRLKGAPLKIAQMLSIDQNLLPEAYAREYAQAQYSAPPLSFPLVVQTFRKTFAKHPDEIFDQFSREAVSGASIGQIHRASLGQQSYAVKVQYPGVADSLQSDLRLVRPFAMRLFSLTAAELDYYLDEVRDRLLEETDYQLELRRSVELAQASASLPHLRFPGFYEELSGPRILTMDWMEGIPLDQFADREPDQEKRDRIGQALWDFYHHQVHTLRVFHADPHPGNFLVSGDHLVVLDFGCVKEIPNDFYEGYFQLLNAEKIRDPQKLEDCLRALTLLLPGDAREDQLYLMEIYRQSIELLARPFQSGNFDFGDPAYLEEIRNFGEKTSNDQRLKKLNSARGSRHSLYVNRAYFGLYSLVSRLRARIRTTLPPVAVQPPQPVALTG